jgi:hypothetical protein
MKFSPGDAADKVKGTATKTPWAPDHLDGVSPGPIMPAPVIMVLPANETAPLHEMTFLPRGGPDDIVLSPGPATQRAYPRRARSDLCSSCTLFPSPPVYSPRINISR